MKTSKGGEGGTKIMCKKQTIKTKVTGGTITNVRCLVGEGMNIRVNWYRRNARK